MFAEQDPLPPFDDRFDGPDAPDAVTAEYDCARENLRYVRRRPYAVWWDAEVRYQRALSALVAQRDRARHRVLLRHQGAA